jgi:hypothetical protein
MTYQLNNHHLYTITDEKWRKQMQYLRRIDLQAVTNHKLQPDNYVYCDDVDEIPRHPDAPFILCNESNLSTLADRIHSKTKTMINTLAFEGHRISMIQHPVTQQIIMSAKQYHERKLVADTLLKKYKYVGFEFTNQSFCQLAVSSFKVLEGELPVDTYGPHQISILEEFPINPVICKTEHFPHERDRLVSIDMRRSYTSILLNNNDVIPVFSYSDKKEVWDPKLRMPVGEYYIDIPVVMANGCLHQRHGWYPLTFVKYCLKQRYIKQENIKFVMKASGFLRASTFVNHEACRQRNERNAPSARLRVWKWKEWRDKTRETDDRTSAPFSTCHDEETRCAIVIPRVLQPHCRLMWTRTSET